MTHPNGNRRQLAFDTLELVVGTAVMCEDAAGHPVGDSLDGFVADLPTEVRHGHIDDPSDLAPVHATNAHNIRTHATTQLVYDLV